MPRTTLLLPLAVASLVAAVSADAALVSRDAAARVGLERAWFTQVTLDASRSRVAGATLTDDALLVLTESGRLQAFDAETGEPRWTATVGPSNLLSLGPTAGGGRCAVVSGATLVVIDTETGMEVLRKRLPGPPGAAPAIDASYAFIPLLGGRVEEVPLDPEVVTPRFYATTGATLTPPSIVGDYLLWTTRRGYVYGADATSEGVVFRFFAAGEPVGSVVGDGDSVYFALREGRVYALRTERGTERWRASVGGDITQPATVLSGVVYVGDDEPALYAFDAKTGARRWATADANRFVAASAERVYALGVRGLSVIDRETGRPLDLLPGVGDLMRVVNTMNDRLYFVSDTGFVQAFHEIDAEKPFLHKAASEEAETAEAAEPEAPPANPFDGVDADEPADEAPADEPEDDPFADPFSDPAPVEDDADDEEDPFGDPFDF